MTILIDGYNLLNATGVEGTGGGTELERARRGLLEFLADALTADELAGTTIVFDASHAPPGLPREENYRGIVVLFAKDYAEADDLIEELIGCDHAPRKLFVISSDHRLHRAARRRRATPIDSEVWIAQLERRSGKPRRLTPTGKPTASPGETDSWLAEFADVDVDAIESEINPPRRTPEAPPSSQSGDVPAKRPKPPLKEGLDEQQLRDSANPFPDDFAAELDHELKDGDDDPLNPFPPGYGEDLTDEDFDASLGS